MGGRQNKEGVSIVQADPDLDPVPFWGAPVLRGGGLAEGGFHTTGRSWIHTFILGVLRFGVRDTQSI